VVATPFRVKSYLFPYHNHPVFSEGNERDGS